MFSKELLDHVKHSEGWVPHRYMDANDGYTIGYGHLVKPGESFPEVLTLEAGEALMLKDLEHAHAAALRLSPILASPLTKPRRVDAITDFVFNAGAGAYEKSTLRQMVNMAMWTRAAVQMKKWVYDDGKIHAGLVKRREVCAEWLVNA